jgi:hypothetical protein
MSEFDRLLADLENTLARQRESSRQMRKSMNSASRYTGRTRRPDFGKTEQPVAVDLLKAETQLRDLDRRGVADQGAKQHSLGQIDGIASNPDRQAEVMPIGPYADLLRSLDEL